MSKIRGITAGVSEAMTGTGEMLLDCVQTLVNEGAAGYEKHTISILVADSKKLVQAYEYLLRAREAIESVEG